jgi:hypothetical protein
MSRTKFKQGLADAAITVIFVAGAFYLMFLLLDRAFGIEEKNSIKKCQLSPSCIQWANQNGGTY